MNYDQVSMAEAAKLRSLGKNVFYKTSLHPKWHPVTGNTCFTVPQMAGLEFSVERELMCSSKESIKNLVSHARAGSSVAKRIISEIAVRAENGVSTAKEVHNQIIAALYLDPEKPPMKYSIINRELAAVFHSLPLTAGGRTVFGHKHGTSGWYEFIRGVADPSHPPYDDYEFAVQESVTEEPPVQTPCPLTVRGEYVLFESVFDTALPRFPTSVNPPREVALKISEIVSIAAGGDYPLDSVIPSPTIRISTRTGEVFLFRNDAKNSVEFYMDLIEGR